MHKRGEQAGQIQITDSGKPRISQKVLRQILSSIANELEIRNVELTPKGDTITVAASYWEQYSSLSEFIQMSAQLEVTCKLKQFLTKLTGDRIHPKYQTMVRTGRTSVLRPEYPTVASARRISRTDSAVARRSDLWN